MVIDTARSPPYLCEVSSVVEHLLDTQDVGGSKPSLRTIIFIKEKEMKYIEINAAEGGDDSKLFVGDLAVAYEKLAQRFG